MFFFDALVLDMRMLPEICYAVNDCADRGHDISAWAFQVLSPDEPYTCFVKNGKSGALGRSDCPFYSGYYLCGGRSSLRCEAANDLLPGLQKDLVCFKHYDTCMFKKGAAMP